MNQRIIFIYIIYQYITRNAIQINHLFDKFFKFSAI